MPCSTERSRFRVLTVDHAGESTSTLPGPTRRTGIDVDVDHSDFETS